MSDFSPTKFINELYDNYYLDYLKEKGFDPNAKDYKYTNEWCFKQETHNFVRKHLDFKGDETIMANNTKKHYELLRLIIYTCCKYIHDKNYIEFLKDILMILLEQQGISLAHEVHYTNKLYLLLNIPPLSTIFKHERNGDRTSWDGIKIANTSVHMLLSRINDSEDICRAINDHIKTSTRSRIHKKPIEDKTTKPTSDASDAEGRKKKSRKSKKYRKSRKSKKYRKSKNQKI